MIALVTCYFQHNFGSALQAFATQKLMDSLGVENLTIRIDGLRSEIKRRKMRYFLSHIFDLQTVADKMAMVSKLLAKITQGARLRSALAQRAEAFNRFAEENFRLSGRYDSFDDLAKAADGYQAFVVGSDQLWLPSNIEADYYTLNFVNDDIKKISLSTSFGVATLPQRQARKAAQFLRRFSSISVREQSGLKLVEQLTGRTDAAVICDPTLFFTAEQWSEHLSSQRRCAEPYIFCYFLGNNPLPRQYAGQLKRQTGFKIVQIQHCDCFVAGDERLADEAPFDVSPFDFIRLIRDARYVLTDSFHATCFSLLFHKEFLTFRRYTKNNRVSTNGRLDSLLTMIGAENRLINNQKSLLTFPFPPCNYDLIDARLTALRNQSQEWVSKVLLCHEY
jgi:hypothetical protein